VSFKWPTFVAVFDNGLVSLKPTGTDVCRWEEIREVKYSSMWIAKEWLCPTSPPTCTLTLQDERQTVVPLWLRFHPLAQTIRDKTSDRLLRAALTSYQAGQSVVFGPYVRVDRSGLTIGNTTVPWPEVKEVNLSDKDGKISVARIGGWVNLSAGHISGIPNYFVMLALVQQIRASTVPTAPTT
jgi:hypothetical protein